MKLTIVKGNIVHIHADAIVLPANPSLKEGAGASKAIFEAAGRKKLKAACEEKGPCKVGSAVPTQAFNLHADYIIHAVVPKWVDGEHDEYNLLSSAYQTSLTIADLMGCDSVAFPLLASGNNGYDLELAFLIAKENIETFTGSNLKQVILVLYGEHAVSVARKMQYDVMDIPEDIHKAKMDQIIQDAKEVAQTFIENRMLEAMKFLKDEKNQEMILENAIKLEKLAIKALEKA